MPIVSNGVSDDGDPGSGGAMSRNYTRMMPDGASESNNSYGEIIGYAILAVSYVIVAGILAVRMYRKSKKRWPAWMRLKPLYIAIGVFCVFLGFLWPLAAGSTFCYFYIRGTYYCCLRGRRSRTSDPEAPSAGHNRPETPLSPTPQSIALPPYPNDRLPDYTVTRSSEDAPSYRSRLNPPEFRGYAPVSELLRDPYTPHVGPMPPLRSGPPGIETRGPSDLEERTPARGESSSSSLHSGTTNNVLNTSSSPVGATMTTSTTPTRTRSTRVSSSATVTATTSATTSADISTAAARAGRSPPTTRVSSPPTRAAVSQPRTPGTTGTLSSAGPGPGSSPSSSPPKTVPDPTAVALPPVGSDDL